MQEHIHGTSELCVCSQCLAFRYGHAYTECIAHAECIEAALSFCSKLFIPAAAIMSSSKGNRGGNRRPKVAGLADGSVLSQFLDGWTQQQGVKKALYFGVYEVTGKTQAVSAEGLFQNHGLLAGVLSAAPHGYTTPSTLRKSIQGLLTKYPALHNVSATGIDVNLWAGGRGDCIMIMLAHIRRLRDDSAALRACKGQASESQWEAIQDLLTLLGKSSDDGDSDAPSAASTLIDPPSDLELDGDGWPLILLDEVDFETPEPKKKKGAAVSSSSKHELQANSDAGSPSKKVAMDDLVPQKNNKKAKHTHEAQKGGNMTSKSFGEIKYGCFTHQSYIQFKDAGGSWRLLVACSSKKSADHDLVIKALALYSMGPNLTKEMVNLHRQVVLDSL